MIFEKYQILIAPIMAWALAQIIKTLIDLIENKRFNPERLIGNGGMPSSHSATVASLAVTALLKYGLDSFEFAISFFFAIVVITDAMGVRLETGKQAKMLNDLIEENFLKFTRINPEDRFKELVGHTPFQVVIGILLGITVALIYHYPKL